MPIDITRLQRFTLAVLFAILIALTYVQVSTFVKNLPDEGGLVLKNGKLAGGDFICFYIAGQIFRGKTDSLYDLKFQREARIEFLDPIPPTIIQELPFAYPPLIAAIFSMIGKLSFWNAFYSWISLGAVLSMSCLFLVFSQNTQASKIKTIFFFAAVLGFVPLTLNTFMSGQLSWIGITIYSLVYFFLRNKHDVLAGALLSFSYYKPPLFLFAVPVLLLTQSRKFALGFALGAAILCLSSLWLVGIDGVSRYFNVISRYTYGRELTPGLELPVTGGAGIYGLLAQIGLPISVAAIALLLCFCFLFLIAYKKNPSHNSNVHFSIWYSFVCLSSISLSIQFIKYDLAILLVPFCLLAPYFCKFSDSTKLMLAAVVVGFYAEFTLREVSIFGEVFNMSSFLLMIFLLILIRQLGETKVAGYLT